MLIINSVILEMEGIAEVTVYGEKNPIMGSVVAAKITPTDPNEDTKAVVRRVKNYCREKLQGYKVPARIKIVNEKQYSERFKKKRSS